MQEACDAANGGGEPSSAREFTSNIDSTSFSLELQRPPNEWLQSKAPASMSSIFEELEPAIEPSPGGTLALSDTESQPVGEAQQQQAELEAPQQQQTPSLGQDDGDASVSSVLGALPAAVVEDVLTSINSALGMTAHVFIKDDARDAFHIIFLPQLHASLHLQSIRQITSIFCIDLVATACDYLEVCDARESVDYSLDAVVLQESGVRYMLVSERTAATFLHPAPDAFPPLCLAGCPHTA